jgi:hypothetical protein
MDLATVALRTADSNPRVLDRLADRWSGRDQDRTGDSPSRASRVDAVLPGAATGSPADSAGEGPREEQEVVLHKVWSQLSVPDRQRFGHCFSFMVLKALGLRPCSAPEVAS